MPPPPPPPPLFDRPLRTLAEVKEFAETEIEPYRVVRLRKRLESPQRQPQILFCHDMQGGYVQDRHRQGWRFEADTYTLLNFSAIDYFVYFSHNFLTIPPVQWINVCHQNGVRVLGTIITEIWNDQSNLCFAQLFSDTETLVKFSYLFAKLAADHGFDGYLINFENGVADLSAGETRRRIEGIIGFLEMLKLNLEMLVGNSFVVWYDSIRADNGRLNHQNMLNSANFRFFKSTDLFFTNYGWNDQCVECSAFCAAPNPQRVFMGIDVFGRGASQHNFIEIGTGFGASILVKKALDRGLSAAVFAPGWVMECNDPLDFILNQSIFMSQINEASNFKNVSKCILYDQHFCTCFSSGRGLQFWINGILAGSPEGWSCLSLSTPIPVLNHTAISLCNEENAYYGGSCLRLFCDQNQDAAIFLIVDKIVFPVKTEVDYDIRLVVEENADVSLILNFELSNSNQQQQQYYIQANSQNSPDFLDFYLRDTLNENGWSVQLFRLISREKLDLRSVACVVKDCSKTRGYIDVGAFTISKSDISSNSKIRCYRSHTRPNTLVIELEIEGNDGIVNVYGNYDENPEWMGATSHNTFICAFAIESCDQNSFAEFTVRDWPFEIGQKWNGDTTVKIPIDKARIRYRFLNLSDEQPDLMNAIDQLSNCEWNLP